MTLNASSYDVLTRDISGQLAALRGDLPAFMKGFGDLSKASLAAGALSEKTKELIVLTLGVAAHCDGCLGFHAKALVPRKQRSRRRSRSPCTWVVARRGGAGDRREDGPDRLPALRREAPAADCRAHRRL